jgi:hypothetical protein
MLRTLNRLRSEELSTTTSALLSNSRLFEAVYPQKSPQSAVTLARYDVAPFIGSQAVQEFHQVTVVAPALPFWVLRTQLDKLSP